MELGLVARNMRRLGVRGTLAVVARALWYWPRFGWRRLTTPRAGPDPTRWHVRTPWPPPDPRG